MYYYICKCSKKVLFFFNVSMEFKETLYMLQWIEIFNVIFNDFLLLKSLREMNTVQLGFFLWTLPI